MLETIKQPSIVGTAQSKEEEGAIRFLVLF